MKQFHTLTYIYLICAAVLVSSCMTRGKGWFTMSQADYPVSLSTQTFDTSKKLVAETDVKIVGKFHTDFYSWSIFWGFIDLTNGVDLSNSVNQQVKNAGGNAVRNLTIKVDGLEGQSFLFALVSWLPFWPTRLSGSATGEIIKYSPSAKEHL